MFQYGKQVSDPKAISPGIYVESLLSGLEIQNRLGNKELNSKPRKGRHKTWRFYFAKY